MRKIAILAILLTIGCGSGGTGVNQGDINLVSLQEEWQLGQQLAADIARQMPVSDDPYISRLGQAIVSQTEMAQLPWQFHVVRDPSINAFAIPGGHVYVHTGLINASRNASELAGVMAHEIAHGVARHGTEQITRQYGIGIIAGMLLGQNAAPYQELLANILATGALARFSRAAEQEADRLGVRYMAGAGYNPEGMASMFQTLLAQERSRPGAVEKFFSTHPLTEDRIRDVQNEAARLPNRSGLRNDDPEFQALKSRV